MPPKANKIATAIAAVNRTVVKNVKAANRAVVKNYNAANRAINRAPAWVKWTIAAIAVAIIGYALWKVFFAGKKEGFYETDVSKIQWVKQDKSKLTIDAMNNYNITNFIDNDTSHLPFDYGVEGAEKNKHVNGVIELEKSTGKDSVFYGDMTVELANYWCGRSNLCGGWQGEMIKGLYGVRFLGRGELKLGKGNIVPSDVHVIFKKGPVQTAADANLQPPNITWGNDFKPLETDISNYMVYWRDTQVSGSGISTIGAQDGTMGTATGAINALKTAKDGSNILVFRGDGKYWLRKASTKDSFRGAVIPDMWTDKSQPTDQFVTVIKKGDTLTFANFDEILEKTAESTTGAADPVEDVVESAQTNHGIIQFQVEDLGLHSEHSLVVNTSGDFKSIEECKNRINNNGGARGGSWQPVSGRTDGKGICRDISWECVVKPSNGKSEKDGGKACTDLGYLPRLTDNPGGFTWFKESGSAKRAHNVMRRLINMRAAVSKQPDENPEENKQARGATHFKDINIAGQLTDLGNKIVTRGSEISECTNYTIGLGGHGFTLASDSDTTYKCWAKKYFPDNLKDASIQTGAGDTYIFSDMLDGNGDIPDIPNESDLNAYGGPNDVSPSSDRQTAFESWLKKSKNVLPELEKGGDVEIYIQPSNSEKYLVKGSGGANSWMELGDTKTKFTYNKTNKTLKVESKWVGASYPVSGEGAHVVFRHNDAPTYEFIKLEFVPVVGKNNVFLIKIGNNSNTAFASMENRAQSDGWMQGWTDDLHGGDNYEFKLSLA